MGTLATVFKLIGDALGIVRDLVPRKKAPPKFEPIKITKRPLDESETKKPRGQA